jgi:hypothetical protein
MRITATFEKRHRSASRLLLGKVLCSVPSVPCLRKSPRPLCFPLKESGFTNDKCKQKSYNHTMCSSEFLYAVLICSSLFSLSNSCQEISQLIRVCSCPRQPLPAQNFFYVSSLMFQHSGKSTWGFFKWVKPGIVWTGW